MANLWSYFSLHLQEDEKDSFPLWAFGETYKSMTYPEDFLQAWNKLHGDVLEICPSGAILNDSEKMVNLWKSTTCVDKIKELL